MNEANRIRTAFLSSLSLHETAPEDRKRLIELTLTGIDDERRDRIAFEIAERLLDSGALERVDRFQRDGKPYVRYRIPASGETFLLAAREDLPSEELVTVSRPHWHARSRLLYRSLSHLIAVERKLFTRDERNLEYLQTDVGEILRTILASARQVLECDETRLFALNRGAEEPRHVAPASEGEP